MLTLRDIAAKAGVSVATVSNIFNHKGRFRPQTEERVLQVARELGYRMPTPHPETGNLGVIFTYLRDERASYPRVNYYIADVLVGIEQVLNEQGFNLLLAGTLGGADALVPSMINDGRLRGVFLVGGRFPEDLMHQVAQQCSPSIVIGTAPSTVELDAVVADNRGGAHKAVTHLVTLGYRDIAFINGPPTTKTSREKLSGYQDGLKEAGISWRGQYVIDGDFTPSSGYRAAHELMERPQPPRAIFVADDPMAMGVLRALRERGLRVPDDVALVGYGDSPESAEIHPALTTVRVHKEPMGRIAARRMLEILQGTPPERIKVVVNTELVVRESSGTGG